MSFDFRLPKFCIFCGEKPASKTKEHVIPQWLIKLTGNPNREANFGHDNSFPDGEFKQRKFSFAQFTFPACDECNGKYSRLEKEAKPTLIKILEGKEILGEDLSTLLDWFDKVRVGLWLGMNQLDKNFANIQPNFHIEKRIGQYDRMLTIEKTDFNKQTLNFLGVNSYAFARQPSAFKLIVNNYIFTNISYMYLFSRRLGFPFPKTTSVNPDDRRLCCDISEGKERIMMPVIRRKFKEKGPSIYQPMYKHGLVDGDIAKYYDTNYVIEHSFEEQVGTGNIFKQEDAGLSEHSKDESISLEPETVQHYRIMLKESPTQIFETQNWLIKEFQPDLFALKPEEKNEIKSDFRTAIKTNNLFIKFIHERYEK